MVTVEFEMIPGEAQAARKFLVSKLLDRASIHGDRIEVSDERDVEVKMLLRKFLHMEGLQGYRVLSESGIVRVEPDNRSSSQEDHPSRKTKGVPPFPPLSSARLPLMDVVYPNYTSRGYGYKKKKR